MKIGNLENHLKAHFIEITNKMIMIIISSGINTGIGAWETENQVRRQDTWNFRQLNLEIGNLKNQTLRIEIFKRNKWVNME